VPYQRKTVRRYGQAVEEFRERLLMLMHMLGGQPARGPEIIGIRFVNTAQGGVRNVFVQGGMVCFVTAYHKNYRQTDQIKVIHRYVPREVGELWVWYAWLVLPFWQQVQGLVKGVTGADKVSAFVWADEIVASMAAADTNADRTTSEAGKGEGNYNTEGAAGTDGET